MPRYLYRRLDSGSDAIMIPSLQNEERIAHAIVAMDTNRLTDAIRFLQLVVCESAEHPVATRLLGIVAHRLGDLDRAERLLRRSLKLGENSLDCLVGLGLVYIDGKRWDAATKCFRECIRRFPQEPCGYINLAFVHFAAGDWANARFTYEAGIAIFPSNFELIANFATMLRESGDLSAAINRYNEIEQRFGLNPEQAEGRGRALLQSCRWVDGWRDYESRLLLASPNALKFDGSIKQWQGEPLNNKRVLVLAEQGIGDEVQFASCFNDLIRITGQCTITCSIRLYPIFSRSFPDARFVALTDAERSTWWPPEPSEYDYVTAAGSLPKYFRRCDSDFPGKPYLFAEQPGSPACQQSSKRRRVGISWWGGSLVSQMKQRSIAFDTFRELLKVENIDFVNLQHGRCDEKTVNDLLSHYHNLLTYSQINPYIDLESWFNLIASLDLVITVDNSNAHFAGALGVKTWLLLGPTANWRWPYNGNLAPWYQSVELIRLIKGSNWDAKIHEVAENLAILPV